MPRLLDPQYPQSNAALRILPRSEKSFALLAALFLSLFVFVFAPGEAGAEEQMVLPKAQWCATPTGTAPPGAPPGTAICPPTVRPSAIDTPPVDTLPVEATMAHGMPSAEPFPPPPGSVPGPGLEQGPGQHPLPSPGVSNSGPEPTGVPQGPPPEAAPGLSDRHGPATPPTHQPDTEITQWKALPMPGSGANPGHPATEGSVAPGSAAEPKPAPSALRKDGPAGLQRSSAPDNNKLPTAQSVPTSPSPPVRSDGKQAPSTANRASDPMPSRVQGSGDSHSTVRQVVEPLVQQDLPSFAAASRSAVDEALTQTHNTVSETVASALGTLESWTADWLPSGEVAQSSSEGAAPDPLIPLVPPMPPLGDSPIFSLPGTMQVGAGGGLGLLLLGVLASGLILLRRDGPLSLISYELPKPTSALLLPLERPG